MYFGPSVQVHGAATKTMEFQMMKLKANECLTWMKSCSVTDLTRTWSNTWMVKVGFQEFYFNQTTHENI